MYKPLSCSILLVVSVDSLKLMLRTSLNSEVQSVVVYKACSMVFYPRLSVYQFSLKFSKEFKLQKGRFKVHEYAYLSFQILND